MLIETQANVLNSHGLKNTREFKINTSATAFKILSSGLYSNKPLAVVRELSANAADAHIAQGTPDLPFEVKMPNHSDTTFYVKDFGPGLSPTDIFELYTTYFSSSKSGTNDYTGGFGLGSKSPFAYTDKFTVVSAHNGVETTYAAYLSDIGTPSVSKITDRPVKDDWQHGIRVSLPIASQDISSFQNAAAQLFAFFRVTPRIIGDLVVTKPSYSVTTPTYGIASDGQHRVIMGNIAYPLNLAQVPLQDSSGVFEVFRFHLPVTIGEVDITASRESLEYTPRTIAHLQTVLNAAMSDVTKHFVTEMLKLDLTDLDQYFSVRTKFPALEKLYYGRRKAFYMRGGMTSDQAERYEQAYESVLRLPTCVGNTEVRAQHITRHYGKQRSRVVDIASGKYESHYEQLKIDKAFEIFIADSTYAAPRCREYLMNGDGEAKDIVLLTQRTDDPAHLVTMLKEMGEKWFKVAARKTSELPAPPKRVVTKSLPSAIQDREVVLFRASTLRGAEPYDALSTGVSTTLKEAIKETAFYAPYGTYAAVKAAPSDKSYLATLAAVADDLSTEAPHIAQAFIVAPSNVLSIKVLEEQGLSPWVTHIQDEMLDTALETKLLKQKSIVWNNLPTEAAGTHQKIYDVLVYAYATQSPLWGQLKQRLRREIVMVLEKFPPQTKESRGAAALTRWKRQHAPGWKHPNSQYVDTGRVRSGLQNIQSQLGMQDAITQLYKANQFALAAKLIATIANTQFK